MEPYLSSTSRQLTNRGQKVPWKRTKEKRFKDWLTLPGMRTNRGALFRSLLSFITENGKIIIYNVDSANAYLIQLLARECMLSGDSRGRRKTKRKGCLECCVTDHEGFRSICLDRWVLQTVASQMHQQYCKNSGTNGPTHYVIVFA